MRSLCARLSLLSVLFFLAAFTTNTFAKSPAPAQADSGATVTDRITQSIDVDHTVTLGRNTRPEANHQNDRGALPEGVALEHMLLLLQHSPEQEAAVNKLIDEQNDRNSPNFHKWLTAEEYGERFGVSVNDLNTVKGWLESQGFRINQVYANHMVIDISGTAGQLRDAFRVSMFPCTSWR
jgi:Pro-kumamolisin, activation domain